MRHSLCQLNYRIFRTFKQAQYLMPIPMTETNKVPHIVQKSRILIIIIV